MSGPERKIRRLKGERSTENTMPFKPLPCGGYAALHATKGWRYYSGRRLRAERRMAQLLGGAA